MNPSFESNNSLKTAFRVESVPTCTDDDDDDYNDGDDKYSNKWE